MSYENELDEMKDIHRQCLHEEFEAKVHRLRENSWLFAFVTIAAIPLVWGVVETFVKNPKVIGAALGVPLLYLLIRQVIVWVGIRRIKTRFATRMMLE